MLSIDDTQHEPAHVSLLPVLHQPQGRHEEASRKKSQLRELAPQKGICIGRKSNRAEEKKSRKLTSRKLFEIALHAAEVSPKPVGHTSFGPLHVLVSNGNSVTAQVGLGNDGVLF